jgi:hypothetical protein
LWREGGGRGAATCWGWKRRKLPSPGPLPGLSADAVRIRVAVDVVLVDVEPCAHVARPRQALWPRWQDLWLRRVVRPFSCPPLASSALAHTLSCVYAVSLPPSRPESRASRVSRSSTPRSILLCLSVPSPSDSRLIARSPRPIRTDRDRVPARDPRPREEGPSLPSLPCLKSLCISPYLPFPSLPS